MVPKITTPNSPKTLLSAWEKLEMWQNLENSHPSVINTKGYLRKSEAGLVLIGYKSITVIVIITYKYYSH